MSKNEIKPGFHWVRPFRDAPWEPVFVFDQEQARPSFKSRRMVSLLGSAQGIEDFIEGCEFRPLTPPTD